MEVLLGSVVPDDQYIDQSVAIKQSVTAQGELQYILCDVPTGVTMSQVSGVPTVSRV